VEDSPPPYTCGETSHGDHQPGPLPGANHAWWLRAELWVNPRAPRPYCRHLIDVTHLVTTDPLSTPSLFFFSLRRGREAAPPVRKISKKGATKGARQRQNSGGAVEACEGETNEGTSNHGQTLSPSQMLGWRLGPYGAIAR